jgi:hypothetical protein
MVWMETRRRAKRFPITTTMLFRKHGEAEWHPASTLNFSHSGVLFQTDGPLPPTGNAVEFIVTLPLNGLTPPPRVRCTGHVVRQQDDLAAGNRAVAVVIDGYAFECLHHALAWVGTVQRSCPRVGRHGTSVLRPMGPSSH